MEKMNYTIKPEEENEQPNEVKPPKKKRKIVGIAMVTGAFIAAMGGIHAYRMISYSMQKPEKIVDSQMEEKFDQEQVKMNLRGMTVEEYNENTEKINELCNIENVEQIAQDLKDSLINTVANVSELDPSTVSIQTNDDKDNPYPYLLLKPAGKIQERYVPRKGLKDIGSWKEGLRKDTREMPGYFYSMIQHITELDSLVETLKEDNQVPLEEVQKKIISAQKALIGFNEKLDITYDSATGFKAQPKQEKEKELKEENKEDPKAEKQEEQEEQKETEGQEEK